MSRKPNAADRLDAWQTLLTGIRALQDAGIRTVANVTIDLLEKVAEESQSDDMELFGMEIARVAFEKYGRRPGANFESVGKHNHKKRIDQVHAELEPVFEIMKLRGWDQGAALDFMRDVAPDWIHDGSYPEIFGDADPAAEVPPPAAPPVPDPIAAAVAAVTTCAGCNGTGDAGPSGGTCQTCGGTGVDESTPPAPNPTTPAEQTARALDDMPF